VAVSEVTIARIAWLAVVLAGVVLVSLVGAPASDATAIEARALAVPASKITRTTLADGRQAIVDAGGQVVPLSDYRRIAAGSIVADELLLALAEPSRIVALTHYGRENSRSAHLFGDRTEIDGPSDVERMRKLQVELLILNHFGAPAELARVREAGIEVFNLGEMRGIATLVPNIESVAILLGDRERGVRLATGLQRRMRGVAADLPRARRKRALYVSAYGGQLFGGAAGTSYHDVLVAAGLLDVAADSFSDWPHYDPEQLLGLDPEVIVTTDASVAQLCRTSGLDHLRACSSEHGAVIGLPEGLIGNPGLGMLDAAEEIRERVYGE
jgi:iron complex transport system substrate-binding protein